MATIREESLVKLYVIRSENAIHETEKMYGGYIRAIIKNILNDDEDIKECLNDTMLKIWNTIPPLIPLSFKAYIGKIARNISLDRYRRENNMKNRPQSGFSDILNELNDCIPSRFSTEEIFESIQISRIISDYLINISDEKKYIFIKRYYYASSIRDISKELSISESKTKTILHRMRNELKICLEKEELL